MLFIGRSNTKKNSIPIQKLIDPLLVLNFTQAWYQSDEIHSLKEALNFLGDDKNVYIISHSAGGRLASVLAQEMNVKKLVCFGYPFKYPNELEDPTRTASFENIQKPLLIIQGLNDVYGGKEILTKYKLSILISFFFVNTHHEFDDLPDKTWEIIYKQVISFIEG